ncbi:MAG TPA: hypothetical protein VKM72_01010 [Thermoanaerobaculia bacterium]|nr:hypothetical protein [Thermoanaerobaculia bacterium]
MKDLFRELAEHLATPEGLRQARLSQMAGLAGAPAPGPAPVPFPRGPHPISIWQPTEIDGERAFVRPEPGPFGDHYATRKVLRPKSAELPLRVAFFGESVAAGYLYAPHLTPAQVLEEQLRAAGGHGNFEVVDLARTNETLAGLRDTVRSSLQIQPDVLVLFVGNNWNLLETPEVSPYAPSVRARQEVALALRDGGLGGPVELARGRLRETATATFDEIALLTRAVGIPVVVVLPEVNLADWETRQPVPWLPRDGTSRWHTAYRIGLDLLARGDATDAIIAAGMTERMLELDGGVCPSTWRLRALARRALGDEAGALEACRAEIDSAAYPTLAFLSAPQATTLARDLLRESARRHDFVAVDLPAIFAEHTGFRLPGRRLFLDYCHLTLEGIRVSMAAVAAEVLRLSGLIDGEPDWRALLASTPEPRIAPEPEATARLGAAIHGAHRLLTVGPKRPILEHWCAAALDASPGIAETFLDLVEARTASCPAVLTSAQQRNLASPYRLLLQHGWQWDHLDAEVLTAIEAVLGGDVSEKIVARRAIPPEGIDLANPYWHWEPLERFFPEVMRFEDIAERATLRAPWPETSFCLVVDGPREVELELTARAPAGNAGEVGVLVDGRAVGALRVGARWTRSRVRVPAGGGLHRLTLRWPDLPPSGDNPLSPAIERLELGLPADLHPVFGEVWSLMVSRP